MKNFPLVSIITVVRNDSERLLSTIQSISAFKTSRVEYVVVDGASTDQTVAVIGSHRDIVDIFISEPDKGLYDAMNKGIALAKGRFLLFLNAGDELLTDIETIVLAAPEKAVLLHGQANMFDANGILRYVKGKRLKSLNRFLKGMPFCHQAILYRRDCMPLYDLQFKVISDRVLTYNMLRLYGLHTAWFVNRVLVNYYEGGFSGGFSHEFLRAEEKSFYRSVGKRHYICIKYINALFKYKIKQPILRVIGRT